jgi:hypothetical protein
MALVQSVSAQTATVSLSENSAHLKYSLLVGGQSFGRSEFGAGFLFNSNDDYLAEVALQVIDEAGSKAPGLSVGLGGKFYGASVPSADLLALAIGGFLRYELPGAERFTLGIDAYYAPNIVSFMDAERFWETALRGEFAVLPQASAFLEIRNFGTELDNGNEIDIGEGARLGLRITF